YVAPSGQTLYCYANLNGTNTVSILPPIGQWDENPQAYYYTWGNYPKPAGDIVIPSWINHNGITYTVTQLGLGGCDSMTSLVVPPSVTYLRCSGNMLTSIVFNAVNCTTCYLDGCTNLSSITIGDTVANCPDFSTLNFTNLYYNAKDLHITNTSSPFPSTVSHLTIGNDVQYIRDYIFSYQPSLSDITVLKSIPPTVYPYTFGGVATNVAVTVPCGSTNAYRNAAYWNAFTNIQDDGTCANTIATATNNNNYGIVVGGGNYYNNETATLYAVPKAYHYFIHWQDGNADNPRTITVNSDSTFTAIFAVVDTLGTIHDTVFIHDTVYVGIDGVDALDAKIYSNGGQIVVEGAEMNTVTLLDINGRSLATKQDYGTPLHFDVPTSGAYLVKIGRHAARKIVVVR
ncbi:MAG: hypothetical protein IJV74_02790, partial [Clostridia bacterium]|nr:hypothetical protein [Clostridia bacterium]